MKYNNKNHFILVLILILSLSFVLYIIFSTQNNNSVINNVTTITTNSSKSFTDTAKTHLKKKLNFIGDSLTKENFTKILDAGEKHDKRWFGKKITISICGIDSRLGTSTPHADANHLVNIWLDSGIVQIISIPRGTIADAGFEDSTGLNYLANVRANRGRKKYLETISEITGVKKIDYYVEFGFSQAIGLLELLGFKDNAVQVLRMLRTRKSFGIGDYQRAYNQGQFIRQMILNNFNLLDGLAGKAMLYGGLYLVDTNLDYSTVQEILKRLKDKQFPHKSDDVAVVIKPKMRIKFEDYDFLEKKSRDSLYKIVLKTASKLDIEDGGSNNSSDLSKKVSTLLHQAINKSKRDTLRYPDRVIGNLYRYFEQRSWYQVIDTNDRASIREEMTGMLIRAYDKTKQPDKARYLRMVLESEKNLKNIK